MSVYSKITVYCCWFVYCTTPTLSIGDTHDVPKYLMRVCGCMHAHTCLHLCEHPCMCIACIASECEYTLYVYIQSFVYCTTHRMSMDDGDVLTYKDGSHEWKGGEQTGQDTLVVEWWYW